MSPRQPVKLSNFCKIVGTPARKSLDNALKWKRTGMLLDPMFQEKGNEYEVLLTSRVAMQLEYCLKNEKLMNIGTIF